MKTVNDILFRASAMGVLMTDPRSKTEVLSETTKSKLIEIYAEQIDGRKEDITSKYLEKGLACEEDGIDMYCRHKGKLYFKNGKRITTDMLTGHADMLVHGEDEAVVDIPDIKNSWSRKTYLTRVVKGMTKDNYWQGQTYCELYGSPQATIVYCLVNATVELIADAKRKMERDMNVIDIYANPDAIEKGRQIERNMIFDMGLFRKTYPHAELLTPLSDWNFDIPESKRITEMVIQRNQQDIDEIKTRVPLWRSWIDQNLMHL